MAIAIAVGAAIVALWAAIVAEHVRAIIDTFREG
jgi:hypothetical protein